MTLLKVLQLGLRRAGLSTTSETFKDSARDYFNMGMKELAAVKQWRWLQKEESLTTTASTATYDLAADCMTPLSFRNTTDDFVMRKVDVLEQDRDDPDGDLSSGPEKVSLVAWNSTTGRWQVRLSPIPDTSSETIKHRYYAYVVDLTSSDDATELDTLGLPNWTHTAVVYYIAGHLMGEKADMEGQANDIRLYQSQVDHYAGIDAEASGQGIRTSLFRRDRFAGDFRFQVTDGSLT